MFQRIKPSEKSQNPFLFQCTHCPAQGLNSRRLCHQTHKHFYPVVNNKNMMLRRGMINHTLVGHNGIRNGWQSQDRSLLSLFSFAVFIAAWCAPRHPWVTNFTHFLPKVTLKKKTMSLDVWKHYRNMAPTGPHRRLCHHLDSSKVDPILYICR